MNKGGRSQRGIAMLLVDKTCCTYLNEPFITTTDDTSTTYYITLIDEVSISIDEALIVDRTAGPTQ